MWYTGWVCPEYVPDFVKMAEAYGSKGYFVTSNDQLKDTILEAREYAEKNKKPVIVECMVAPDELVMPMIKGGASFEDIMLQEDAEMREINTEKKKDGYLCMWRTELVYQHVFQE